MPQTPNWSRRKARPQSAASTCEKSQTSSGSVLVDLASSHIYWRAKHGRAIVSSRASRSSAGPMVELSADFAGSGLATPWAIMRAPHDPIALPYSRRVRSRPFPSEPPHGSRPSRHDADRDARRTRRVVRGGQQAEVAVSHRYRAREIRVHGRGPRPGALRGPPQHPRAARRHAASAGLGADHRGRQRHRSVRRHRRRRDLARAGRAVRAFRGAGRDRAPDLLGADGASCAGQGSRATARDRLSRARHDAELEPRRDPDDAQGPLPHHDRLHAEGGQATAST